MKKGKVIFVFLLSITFIGHFFLLGDAVAGFGLKNMMDKAKDTVKGKVEKEVSQGKEDITSSSGGGDSILFSTTPITSPDKAVSTITAGENIYGLAVFDRPLKDVIKEKEGKLQFTITVKIAPSDMFKTYKVPVDSSIAQSTDLPFEIAPDPDISMPLSAPYAFPRILSWQKSGNKKVEVNIMATPVGGTSSKKIAEGSFILKANDGGAEKYAQLEQQLKAGENKKKSMPKPAQKNKSLEKQAMAALQEGSRLKFLRIVIMESDWTVERDSLGNILHKRIKVGAGVKTVKGGCRVNLYYVKKDYLGGGKYSDRVTRLSTIPGGTDIACENIHK